MSNPTPPKDGADRGTDYCDSKTGSAPSLKGDYAQSHSPRDPYVGDHPAPKGGRTTGGAE